VPGVDFVRLLRFAEAQSRGWFVTKCYNLSQFAYKAFCALSAFAWRALEFHAWRLVAITVFAAAAHQVLELLLHTFLPG